MSDLALAVQRVQGAVGTPLGVGHAQRDGVKSGQVRPDEVLQAAGIAVGQQDGLATAQQLPDQAGLEWSADSVELLGQVGETDQLHPFLFEQHESARVRTGQFGETVDDPVQHRLEAQVGVDVGDDVGEPSHQARAFHRRSLCLKLLVPRVEDQDPPVVPSLVVVYTAGADPYVQGGPVPAQPTGEYGQRGSGAHLFEHRAVLGPQLTRDDR